MKIGDKFKSKIAYDYSINTNTVYAIKRIVCNQQVVQFINDDGGVSNIHIWNMELLQSRQDIEVAISKYEAELLNAIADRNIPDIEKFSVEFVNAIRVEQENPYFNPLKGDVWEFMDNTMNQPCQYLVTKLSNGYCLVCLSNGNALSNVTQTLKELFPDNEYSSWTLISRA